MEEEKIKKKEGKREERGTSVVEGGGRIKR